MAEVERETVVVEGERRPSYGWLIGLIIFIILLILFFLLGGAELFNGGGAETINVDTPDTINVIPAP